MTSPGPEVTIRCAGHRRRRDQQLVHARIAVATAVEYDGSYAWQVRGDGVTTELRLDSELVRSHVVRGDGSIISPADEEAWIDASMREHPRYTLRCRGCLSRGDAHGGDVQIAEFDVLAESLEQLVAAGRSSVTLPDLDMLISIVKKRRR
ncbi:MAG: hypothetical protein ACTH8F_08695 [Microbacterium sp.]|uniref:hypothetical protein n=1 Tax=Microbacterium sp. TaxID=51671 RepID=UPI003F94BC9D